ncbi:hypothetical protein [Candidatus Enterococcus ikei]|nr:hypothetical protein [Enterococcus sp. DIV0869a]
MFQIKRFLNGGKEYQNSEELQIPDPYEDIWVLDDPFGEGS